MDWEHKWISELRLHKWKIPQCVILAHDHSLQGVLYSPTLHICDIDPLGGVVNTSTVLWTGISWGTFWGWYWCYRFLNCFPVFSWERRLYTCRVSHVWLILRTVVDSVLCWCLNKTSAKSLCNLIGERLGKDCWLFFNILIKPFGIIVASSFTQLSEQVLSMHKDIY